MAKNKKKLGTFTTSQLNNASKTLLANIRFASIDERIKTIAVTSSQPNEGKTSVSTNLANAIATSGKKVLIVDTDMRRRCLAQMLNLHPAKGLYSVLSGSATLNEAIVPTSIPNLFFMDSEPKIPSPPDILSTKRFAALVDSLREQFDYVIFDTPPVSTFVDAAIIGNLVDGTLFVIRQGFTKRTSISSSIQQITAANARIIGTVMTFCDAKENDYYYAYYTQDGDRVDKSKDAEEVPSKDLDGGDLGAWSRRAGVAPKSIDAATRHSRPSRNAQSASGIKQSAAGSLNSSHQQSAAMGRSASAMPGRSSQPGDGGNPFQTGAFKAVNPIDSRSARHKRTRL